MDCRVEPYDMHTSHRSVFTRLKKLSLFKLCIRDLSLNFPTHGSAKCLMQSLFLRCVNLVGTSPAMTKVPTPIHFICDSPGLGRVFFRHRNSIEPGAPACP